MEGYIKKVEGITSSSQGFQNQFQYKDQLEATRLLAWISYLIRELKILISGLVILLPKMDIISLNSYHRIPKQYRCQAYCFGRSELSHPEISIISRMNWRTGKPYTEPLSVTDDEILYYPPNTSSLDEYLRIDISAKYKIKISSKVNAELGASIWNLLNKHNILNIFYQIDSDSEINEVQQYALSFTPNFMFRINF